MSFPDLLPALITPFSVDESIDTDAHRHNLGVLSGRGIEGFLIGGSTGEGPLLEPGERAVLTSAGREVAPASHLMVGIMAESVRQARRQIDEVAEIADSVLVLSPLSLGRTSESAHQRFFLSLADSSPLPLLLYSVPRNTGYALAESVVVAVSGHPNIVGMKDSGGDAERIGRIIKACPDDFVLYNGASRTIAPAISAGVHGIITASANYIVDLLRALLDAARRGDDTVTLQGLVTEVSGVVEESGVGGVKVAADRAGLRPGVVRAPLDPASEDLRSRIRELPGF